MLLRRARYAFLLLSLASLALAQTAGSPRGTVTDPSGAVVPEAQIVLKDEATQFARHVASDTKGGYYFGTVQPGDYTLTVTASSLKATEIRNIHIGPNDTRCVNARIEIGPQTETVEVTASQDIISTETGDRGWRRLTQWPGRPGLRTPDHTQPTASRPIGTAWKPQPRSTCSNEADDAIR
jgi:hypothetical protein